MRETTIEELKRLAYIFSDKAIDDILSNVSEKDQKFLETVNLSNNYFNGSKNFVYEIPQLIGNCYKNFCINKKYIQHITSIKLEIGGQLIDTVYAEDFDALYKILEIPTDPDSMYIPIPIDALSCIFSVELHEIKLIFNMHTCVVASIRQDADSFLKYDAYYDNDYKLNPSKQVVIKQVQTGMSVEYDDGMARLMARLNFNHPITHIKTSCSKTLDLEISGMLKLHIDSENNDNIFKLGNVNFSRLGCVKISEQNKRIFAVSLNILRFADGMSGIAYSN